MRLKVMMRPGIYLVASGVFFLLGWILTEYGNSYKAPQNYNVNAFDAIFIIPLICKAVYYKAAENSAKGVVKIGKICYMLAKFCLIPFVGTIAVSVYYTVTKKKNPFVVGSAEPSDPLWFAALCEKESGDEEDTDTGGDDSDRRDP